MNHKKTFLLVASIAVLLTAFYWIMTFFYILLLYSYIVDNVKVQHC